MNEAETKCDTGNEIESLEPPTCETKQERLIRNLFLYPSTRQAAINAGYSEGTANGCIYNLVKRKDFQERIREYAIANDLLNIPKIARIEQEVINHLEENPLDLPKFKDTIKQKKVIAGLLRPETTDTRPVTVNIQSVQNMLLQGHDSVSSKGSGK